MAWLSWRKWFGKGRGSAGADADSEAEADAEAGSEADSDSEADSEADAEAEADADSEADAEGSSEVEGVVDELDLHTFLPREVADVVEEFVRWSAERGLRRVRIIHGKGTGTLRRIVHATLARQACVVEHGLCDGQSGGWGATWAHLRWPPRDD